MWIMMKYPILNIPHFLIIKLKILESKINDSFVIQSDDIKQNGM